jgi:hypothetical protein
MTTGRIIVVAITSVIAGLSIGVSGASWYWLNFNGQLTTSSFATRTQANIITKVAVLEQLRAGQPKDAERNLQQLLDGDLIAVAALGRDGHVFGPSLYNALALEQAARHVGAYAPTDADIEASVAEAFGLASPGKITEIPSPPFKTDVPEGARR